MYGRMRQIESIQEIHNYKEVHKKFVFPFHARVLNTHREYSGSYIDLDKKASFVVTQSFTHSQRSSDKMSDDR